MNYIENYEIETAQQLDKAMYLAGLTKSLSEIQYELELTKAMVLDNDKPEGKNETERNRSTVLILDRSKVYKSYLSDIANIEKEISIAKAQIRAMAASISLYKEMIKLGVWNNE